MILCYAESSISKMLHSLSANTGILAADIGMPQLSMHSIREMMGSKDLSHAYQFFTTFLLDKTKIEEITK